MFSIRPLFAQEPLPRVIKFTACHLHTQYSLRLRLEYDFERNFNLIHYTTTFTLGGHESYTIDTSFLVH